MLALPVLGKPSECADYWKTVEPYAYQLGQLPGQVMGARSWTALSAVYAKTNPFVMSIALSLAFAPLFFVAAELNRNWSQVDRFWAIIPTVYFAHYVLWAHSAGFHSPRLLAVLAASTFWSVRLAFNYWRRGGYTIGHEDYRWAIVKEKIGAIGFVLLDLTFISVCQNLVLVMITSPCYLLLLSSAALSHVGSDALQIVDLAFFGLIVALVSVTAVADQQQWNYQEAKTAYKKGNVVPQNSAYSKEDLEKGFLTQGLFAYSRHPNFCAEQAVWWCYYLWGCAITQTLLNWTIVGPLSYCLIFQGSTPLTEWITSSKYPEYRAYQQQVPRFLPHFLTACCGCQPKSEGSNPAENQLPPAGDQQPSHDADTQLRKRRD